MAQWITFSLDDGSKITRSVTEKFGLLTNVVCGHLCIGLHFGGNELYCGASPEGDNGRIKLLRDAVTSGKNIDISQWCEFELQGE